MRFLLRPSTHAYRGLLDFALRALLVSSLVSVILLENINTTKPDYIHEGTYLSKFWDRYLAEVKAMMEERNPGSRFSIYAFYVKDADELVATMTEKEFKGFKRSFNRADFVERFPTFSTYLKDKLYLRAQNWELIGEKVDLYARILRGVD